MQIIQQHLEFELEFIFTGQSADTNTNATAMQIIQHLEFELEFILTGQSARWQALRSSIGQSLHCTTGPENLKNGFYLELVIDAAHEPIFRFWEVPPLHG